jgi:hypothetical protein
MVKTDTKLEYISEHSRYVDVCRTLRMKKLDRILTDPELLCLIHLP